MIEWVQWALIAFLSWNLYAERKAWQAVWGLLATMSRIRARISWEDATNGESSEQWSTNG